MTAEQAWALKIRKQALTIIAWLFNQKIFNNNMNSSPWDAIRDFFLNFGTWGGGGPVLSDPSFPQGAIQGAYGLLPEAGFWPFSTFFG